jgi:hypothetical protein
MQIEFLCRTPKLLTEEQESTLNDQAKALLLIDKTGELTFEKAKSQIIEEDGEHRYVPWVLNLKDISDFYFFDNEHTKVIKYNNTFLVLKINYYDFKAILQFGTHELIASAEEFIVNKPKITKK